MGEDVKRLVVIGGSAGAIPVLHRVVRDLPQGFPAAILAVVHLPPRAGSNLPGLLAASTQVGIRFARDGDALTQGLALLAPPDFHLLVRGATVQLSRGPRENLFRPAIDPLFRTAAASWGPRAVAVVQDPADAPCPDMPQSAMDYCGVDHTVRGDELAGLLIRLVAAPPATGPRPGLAIEGCLEFAPTADVETQDRLGRRSPLTCPECGGVLWEIDDGDMLRYRCHTGHALSVEAMAQAQGNAAEKAMWSAVRVLRERVALARRMIARALEQGHHKSAELWQQRAEDYDSQVDALLSLLLRGEAERSG